MGELAGRNQRMILNYLTATRPSEWRSAREICVGTGLSRTRFYKAVGRLVALEVVDSRVDPYNGRATLYRRSEVKEMA